MADPAVKQAALTFVPVAAFEGCGADLGDLGSDTLAAELAAWVDAQGLKADAQVATDAQGRAVFPKLACGLYLVEQAGGAEGFSTLEPFAVSVPMTSADGSGWVYDVAANPKVVEQPVEPEEPVAPGDPEDSGQPAQPDDSKLPQTGLDLGLVGALAVGGVLVFSLGWALAFMGRRRRAEGASGVDGDGGDAR